MSLDSLSSEADQKTDKEGAHEVPPIGEGHHWYDDLYFIVIAKGIFSSKTKRKSSPPPVPSSPGTTPQIRANLFSKMTFAWVSPLLAVGYKRPLQQGDLWNQPDAWQNDVMTDKFLQILDRRRNQGQKKFLLLSSLNELLYRHFWFGGLVLALGDVSQCLMPLLTRHIIQFVEDRYYHLPGASNMGHGVGMAIGLALMIELGSLCSHNSFYYNMLSGGQARSVLISALYRKSLKLSNRSRIEYANGDIINMMSTDTFRVDFAAKFFHHIWDCFIFLGICIALLIINIGVSALAGIAVLFAMVPVLMWFSTLISRKRKAAVKLTDHRVRIITEVLKAMKMVKFYAWENAYVSRIMKVRVTELRMTRNILLLRSTLFAFAVSLPIFSSMVAFIVLSVTRKDLQAPTVFSSLSLFSILRMPLMFLPLAITTSIDAAVGLERLEKFLLAEEAVDSVLIEPSQPEAIRVVNGFFVWDTTDTANANKESGEHVAMVPESSIEKDETGGSSIDLVSTQLERVETRESRKDIATGTAIANSDDLSNSDTEDFEKTLSFVERRSEQYKAVTEERLNFPGLKDINLSIKRGEFIVITGAIGSGKSSILAALSGTMKMTKGEATLCSSVAYCPQPWIQSTTFKENILFGKPFDEKKYEEVVECCALRQDIELLPEGDETEVGERGITISGGQKARISLARAAYFDADIILLDDVLSAVDPHVGRHIIEKCLCGYLKNSTRVLATHQLHVLSYADRIIFTPGDGSIVMGTMEELTNSTPAFKKLIDLNHMEGSSEDDSDATKEENLTRIDTLKNPPIEDKEKQHLMQIENRETEGVSSEVYKSFVSLGGGALSYGIVPLIIVVVILAQGSQILSSLWLSWWTSNRFIGRSLGFYIGIYVMLGVLSCFFLFWMGALLTTSINRSSRELTRHAVLSILRAPMSFFDTSPLGRLTNRFSKDTDVLDNTITDSLRTFLVTLSGSIGSVILIIAYFYWFAIAVPPLATIFVMVSKFYRASAREIKRLDSLARSSVFSQFGETLTGVTSIKAFREQDRFITEFDKKVNHMNNAYFLTFANQRWLGIRLDFVGVIMTLIVALLSVTRALPVSASSAGLVLSYATSIVGMMSFMVTQLAEAENDMNAAERLYEYGFKIKAEAPLHIEETAPPEDWPQKGGINFSGVDFRYRHGLPLVLHGLSVNIRGGEKIGVCGRTGAGKSSIMVALYRMGELASGSITIDGIDISKIGLHDLRTKLTIIPQDPVLFQGTLRSNLDPFGTASDIELWDALRRSHLNEGSSAIPSQKVEEIKDNTVKTDEKFHLDKLVEEDGQNFSMGERQLVSLARALIRDNRILVLDEATSNVDYETDQRIQTTIQTEFTSCTILCIAHRLRTILSYDKILVLEQGKVKEFDTPWNLFSQKDSIFAGMCKQSNINDDEFPYRN